MVLYHSHVYEQLSVTSHCTCGKHRVKTQVPAVTAKPVEVVRKEPPQIVLSGCDLVRSEVAKYDGWDANVMTAISKAESDCTEVKPNLSAAETHRDINGNVICVGSYGALQVGCIHYLSNPQELDTISTNIRVAHVVWLEQGYDAWTMYRNGRYANFL